MVVPELSLMNINHRYYSIETFFKAAGEAGYRNIELWTGSMHLYVDCHEHESVDKIRDLAAQYGIKIVCVCPEQNNPKPWNVAVRGEAGQKRILSYFKNVIDVAVELGAPQILVTSGWAYLDEPAEDASGPQRCHAALGVRLRRHARYSRRARGTAAVGVRAGQRRTGCRAHPRGGRSPQPEGMYRLLLAPWKLPATQSTATLRFWATRSFTPTLSMWAVARRILPGATASVICVPTSRHSCATAIRAMLGRDV